MLPKLKVWDVSKRKMFNVLVIDLVPKLTRTDEPAYWTHTDDTSTPPGLHSEKYFCMYTGMHDSAGVEIFENDLILSSTSLGQGHYISDRGESLTLTKIMWDYRKVVAQTCQGFGLKDDQGYVTPLIDRVRGSTTYVIGTAFASYSELPSPIWLPLGELPKIRRNNAGEVLEVCISEG